MNKHETILPTLLVFYYICLISAEQCPLKLASPNCSCNGDAMTCSGVDDFPVVSNSTIIKNFIFIDCIIPTVGEIPYKEALVLHIENSGVQKFAENAFNSMSLIKEIKITGNNFSHLPSSIFDNITNIKILDLQNNGIEYFGKEAFARLKKLSYLNLSLNPIGENFVKLFIDEMPKMQEFYCDNCSLTSSVFGSFKNLPDLTKLSLTSNNFYSFNDGIFLQFKSLEELNMDNCNIQNFSLYAIANLPKLNFLSLSNNNISCLEDEELRFDQLKDNFTLEVLLLHNNNFKSLNQTILSMKNLRNITLGGNPWSCDCDIAWIVDSPLNIMDKTEVVCYGPEEFRGQNLFEVGASKFCESPSESRPMLIIILVIPVVLICLSLSAYYLWQIVQNRRRYIRERETCGYKPVYCDTIESSLQHGVV